MLVPRVAVVYVARTLDIVSTHVDNANIGNGIVTVLTSIDDIVLELASAYSVDTSVMSIRKTLRNTKRYSLDYGSKNAINNIAQQMQTPEYITRKQGNLVLKIIRRYRKVLHKNGFDVKYLINEPHFKYDFRVVNYSKKIFVDDDLVNIQFPYNGFLINHIKAKLKDYRGHVMFEHKEKLWQFDLLEDFFDPDIIQLFLDESFELCDKSKRLLEQCNNVRGDKFSHLPMIDYEDGKLVFRNCEDELIEHFTKNVGLLGEQELSIIIDKCSNYGLIVNPRLKKLFTETYGDLAVKDIYFNKTCRIDADKVSMLELVNYIKVSDRKPVFIVICRQGNYFPKKADEWMTDRTSSTKRSEHHQFSYNRDGTPRDATKVFKEEDYFYNILKDHLKVNKHIRSYDGRNDKRLVDHDSDVILLDYYPRFMASKLIIVTRDQYPSSNNDFDYAEKIVYYY